MQTNNPKGGGPSSSNASNMQELPSAAKEEIIRLSEVWHFQKQDRVLEADEYAEHVYFIATGLLLSYVQRGDEKIVKWVRSTGDVAFAQNAENTGLSLKKQLTGQIVVALEETNVIRISFENIKRLQNRYPQIDNVMTHHILGCIIMEKWLTDNRYLPPKRKYEFVQCLVGPNLSKVPDIYLASWIGITLDELKEVRKDNTGDR